MPQVINTLRHRKRVKDQTIGAVQRNGIAPTVCGIARDRLIAKAARQAYDSAEAIQGLLNAADSADPDVAGVANFLLGNREFLGAMCKSLEGILDDLKAQAQQPASAASQPSANADPTSPVATEAPDDDPTRGGSGFPGADSAAGPYTKAQLLRDITTQNAAAATLSRSVGVDAANARVSRTPLVIPWDSPRWTAEAREHMRTRAATGDGWAAQHMRADVPAMDRYFSE